MAARAHGVSEKERNELSDRGRREPDLRVSMFDQPRFAREAWLPIAAGLLWLWCAESFGPVGFLFSLLPGCLLLASGVAALLWPGDIRIPQFGALGGLIGVPLALPAFVVAGPEVGAVLVLLSAASFLAAGAASVRQEPHVDDVPEPEPSLRLAAAVAVDEALLATIHVTNPVPGPGARPRILREVMEARELFEQRGWLEKPERYHAAPPSLIGPEIRPAESRGIAFEHLSFESGYEPYAEEPGRERWLSYDANQTAHAWVMRHKDPSRPWLVCIHGYQMGWPLIDFGAFQPGWLHERLGLNLLLPVLPLHGLRKVGRRSGDGFLSGDTLDSVHAEAQAMWDVRRLLSWVRAQGTTQIGVYGLSLGGYNTALLASLDDGLACAIPGIPAVDFTRLFWRHGPPLQLRYLEKLGIVQDEVGEVMRAVSPLALSPKLPRDRRTLFAAVSDRLVPADQVRDLWVHWDRPRILWYQGSHLSFRFAPGVQALIASALREAGLARPDAPSGQR